MQKETARAKSRLIYELATPVGFFLGVFGVATLAGIGWLVWYDATSWGKDITLIFFGSRTGEAIGLGIGMKVIHHFLLGTASLLIGLLTFLRRRSQTTHTSKVSEGILVTIPKTMVEDIRKRAWFKNYSDIGDFILNAIRGSIENWEKFEKK